MWGEGWWLFVVRGSGVVGAPVSEEPIPGAGPEGLVGSPHEFRWRDVCSGWGRGVSDKREVRESFL